MISRGRVCTFGPFHVDRTRIETSLPIALDQQTIPTAGFELIIQLQNQLLLFLQLKFNLLIK